MSIEKEGTQIILLGNYPIRSQNRISAYLCEAEGNSEKKIILKSYSEIHQKNVHTILCKSLVFNFYVRLDYLLHPRKKDKDIRMRKLEDLTISELNSFYFNDSTKVNIQRV